MTAEEFKRQRRVIDQSLSAHTSLAEGLRRRRRLLIMSIIVFSVAGIGLAFSSDQYQIDLVFNATPSVWAGVLSALVFVLALTDLVFGWDKTAAEHEDAARRLAALAALYRSGEIQGEMVESGSIDLDSEYWSAMNSIARIPSRHFIRLKAEHLRKVERSKAVGDAPSASLLVMRVKFCWEDTKKLWRHGDSAAAADSPETFLPDES